jgi:hypothetical protein
VLVINKILIVCAEHFLDREGPCYSSGTATFFFVFRLQNYW